MSLPNNFHKIANYTVHLIPTKGDDLFFKQTQINSNLKTLTIKLKTTQRQTSIKAKKKSKRMCSKGCSDATECHIPKSLKRQVVPLDYQPNPVGYKVWFRLEISGDVRKMCRE